MGQVFYTHTHTHTVVAMRFTLIHEISVCSCERHLQVRVRVVGSVWMNLAVFFDQSVLNGCCLGRWLFCDVFPLCLVDGHMVQSGFRFEDRRFFCPNVLQCCFRRRRWRWKASGSFTFLWNMSVHVGILAVNLQHQVMHVCSTWRRHKDRKQEAGERPRWPAESAAGMRQWWCHRDQSAWVDQLA